MKKAIIMGILNITPDSFSDGGRYFNIQDATTQIENMIADGADIIDIGAESTRPGYTSVSINEELARFQNILPPLKNYPIQFSIDTTKYEVARYALENGVTIVNDVNGVFVDDRLCRLSVKNGCDYVIMHNGEVTGDVVLEVSNYFERAIKLVCELGLSHKNIILDVGIGFGKTYRQNIELLRNIDVFCNLGYKHMLGLSNKRVIGETLNVDVNNRTFGTLGANLLAYTKGVDIFRVHNVKAHREALDMIYKINAEGKK